MEGSPSEPTVASEILYQGRIVNLRVDTVRLPTMEIAEHSPCVCIVPMDTQGNVLLVRQYRKAAEAQLLAVPAGGVEPGEGSQEAVLRELREETGFTAGTLHHLSSFWMAPGWSTEYMHAYLATDLSPAILAPDADEIISVVRVPVARIPELVQNGEIQDAKSIVSLLLAMRLLGES